MTREEFKSTFINLRKEVDPDIYNDALQKVWDHDAAQRQVIEQQAQENVELKRSLHGYEISVPFATIHCHERTIQALQEVLRSMCNNILGALGIAERDIRLAIGNTNVACLQSNIQDAQHVLQETT